MSCVLGYQPMSGHPMIIKSTLESGQVLASLSASWLIYSINSLISGCNCQKFTNFPYSKWLSWSRIMEFGIHRVYSSPHQCRIYASVNWVVISSGNCLFGTKPLLKLMLALCLLDSREQISVKFELKFYHFHSRKCIWKCCLPKQRPFCPCRGRWVDT